VLTYTGWVYVLSGHAFPVVLQYLYVAVFVPGFDSE
jgi:hypothetical protein